MIPINSRRIFKREEAEEILPIVRRITDRAAAKLSDIQEQLKWVPPDEPLFLRLKGRMELAAKQWASKIARLGCEPRGIWLVDFDAGEGWFSWRYGDDGLNYFRTNRTLADLARPTEQLPT